MNLGMENVHLNSFELLPDATLNIGLVDVDLQNQKMGRISADTYDNLGYSAENIVIQGMNLLSDTTRKTTVILFADDPIRDRVATDIKTLPDGHQKFDVYAPIYKYNVEYSADDTYGPGGNFVFTRYSSGKPESYNPTVLSAPVSSQSGGYATVNETFNFAFEHSDAYSMIPSMERSVILNANKYAINEAVPLYAHLEKNVDTQSGLWIRPYTTFENIGLKNGPNVDTITYGTLVGGDSSLISLSHGWNTVFTGYVGYNGSTQHYQGADTIQNGGLLGITETFYKNNFYTAITALAGSSVGISNNMYGQENFTMLMSGVASKTGYDFEFKDGKFIVQPSLLLGYTFVNTFDYNNAAGVRIKSEPLHALQIHPDVKVIYNTKKGWEPYVSAGVVYNVLDKSEVTANDVKLPSMSIKPYAEYGVGIQKRWKDRFTGFIQAMVRNGGRNGVAITFGFKFKVGKTPKL